ncbi:UPF0739 protein C1orf74 homolog [Tubulanus polymorphus]|uniref:UPF0739 protein C1orf74 homolog n=1 Tax=Tubulanus polymorphus TaxID=672921 RepID=UPI003DA52ADC
MSLYDCWKQTVVETFGKKSRRKVHEIVRNVLAIDARLKPAYLFDELFITVETMFEFLQNLRRRSLLLVPDPAIVRIDDTIFLTTVADLKTRFFDVERDANSTCRIVDISDTLESPVVLDYDDGGNGKRILDTFRREIRTAFETCREADGISILTVPSTAESNRSTMFGMLLGYPVVYWYRGSDPYDCKTCLDCVPLSVYKVDVEFELFSNLKLPTDSIYSFSIPQACSEAAKGLIDVWYKHLQVKADDIGANMKLTVDSVTLDSFAL